MSRPIVIFAAVLLASGCRDRSSASDPVPRPPPPPVEKSAPKPRARVLDDSLPTTSVWRSPSACERAVRARVPSRRTNRVRLGTWNVRWFPDGRPGRRASGAGGTDIAWLACTIAWMDVDAIAVQEFKAHERARERISELLRGLDRHTGGSWRIALDDCRGGDAGQHVGILWNAKRVRASAPLTLASLNPHGQPCKDQLRPGLALHLSFPGGLDLHLVSVHAKSGPDRRSFDLRKRSLSGFSRAFGDLTNHVNDTDVVVAGDFNTMGCRRCSPAVTPEAELGEMDAELGALTPAFRRVKADQPCSEYFSGGSGLLDHFVVSSRLAELDPRATASVSGACGELACKSPKAGGELAAKLALSDHCPVLLELSDRDLD